MKIVKVDADENPQLAADYGIVSIPTLNIYAGGELVASASVPGPKSMIAEDIESVLASV